MDISLSAIVISNKGLVRSSNQDNLVFNKKTMLEGEEQEYRDFYSEKSNNHIFAVCDGMGGQSYGEKASYIAANMLLETIQDNRTETIQESVDRINGVIAKAGENIFDLSNELNVTGNIGTTVAGLKFVDDKAVAINAGDSRVYLYREKQLMQITTDHTEAQRMLRLGVITNEQVRGHKSRNMLTKYIGISPEEGEVEGTVSEILDVQKKDLYILCSDGLTDMVLDEKIKEIISKNKNIKNIAQELISEALNNGGTDNITVIIVFVEKIRK